MKKLCSQGLEASGKKLFQTATYFHPVSGEFLTFSSILKSQGIRPTLEHLSLIASHQAEIIHHSPFINYENQASDSYALPSRPRLGTLSVWNPRAELRRSDSTGEKLPTIRSNRSPVNGMHAGHADRTGPILSH